MHTLKLRPFLILSACSLVLFAAVTLLSARLPVPISQQAAAGKRVWQKHNCVSCHTLFGNGGYVGEDLTNIVAKVNPPQLVQYLIQPPVMRPNRYRHHPALKRTEAENVVSYLEYVHTIPTLGWPPQPQKAGDEP